MTRTTSGVPYCPYCGGAEDAIGRCLNPHCSLKEAKEKAVEKGWECPKCGAILAPFFAACFRCGGRRDS